MGIDWTPVIQYEWMTAYAPMEPRPDVVGLTTARKLMQHLNSEGWEIFSTNSEWEVDKVGKFLYVFIVARKEVK